MDHLLATEQIPVADIKNIQAFFTKRMRHMEDVIDHTAKALSSLTNYTAVVVSPKSKDLTIRNVQLVPINQNTALMVLITSEGMIKDAVIRIPSSIGPDTLYTISVMLTKHLQGHPLSQVHAILSGITASMAYQREILETIIQITEGVENQSARVSVGGGSNILNYPEYADASKAQSFLSLLEAKDTLAKPLSSHGEMAFTVRIGAETGIETMEDLSVVSAAFTFGKGSPGTFGIIGPTRMHYGKVMAILNAMGTHLSQLFEDQE